MLKGTRKRAKLRREIPRLRALRDRMVSIADGFKLDISDLLSLIDARLVRTTRELEANQPLLLQDEFDEIAASKNSEEKP